MAAANWRVSDDTVETRNDGLYDVSAATWRRKRPAALTAHARKRGARRNVAPDAVDYVLAHGRMVQRTGVTFFFLGRRDIPLADGCASWALRLEGTTVLLAPDGMVITVYRNRCGLRAVLRKLKYRIPDRERRTYEPDVALHSVARWANA